MDEIEQRAMMAALDADADRVRAHNALKRRAARCLADLSLLPEGATHTYGQQDASRGADVDRTPHAAAARDRIADFYRERIANATPDTLADVLDQAEEEIRATKRRDPSLHRGESDAEFEARVVADGEGMTLGEAAEFFRITELRVAAIRRDHGRIVYDGHKLERKDKYRRLGADAKLKAIEMVNVEGQSTRTVAEAFGVSPSAVQKWLKAA